MKNIKISIQGCNRFFLEVSRAATEVDAENWFYLLLIASMTFVIIDKISKLVIMKK